MASSTAKPLVLVVTGTSGAGKGTLEKLLLERMPEVELAVSATTRDQRPGEQNGREYWFITPEKFESLVDEGEFLEYVDLPWGARSGTLRSEIDRIQANGKVPLLDLETDGALRVQEAIPGRSRSSSTRRRSRSSNVVCGNGRRRAPARFRFDSTWLANNKR